MTLVAAVQMASGPTVSENLTHAGHLIAQAAQAGAKLVALPENFALMAAGDPERLGAAEPDGSGPIQGFLATAAREHRVWLVGGTIPMATPGGSRVRASCLVYDDRGTRVARYDKIHLFDVQLGNGERYRESSSIEGGDETVVVPTPFGNVGLAVCYDLRFPELFRRLLDGGAELFVVPSAFTAHTGRAHWEVLLRARAVENLAYVIAPDQGGRHINGRETHGHTMIINPWGEILRQLPRGPGVVLAECDLSTLRAMRAQLPSIEHRRL